MKRVHALSVLVLSALALLALLVQRNLADVQIVTTDLGNGIYMLEGSGGNLGVSVGEDGVFLIDDQMAPLTDRILAALAELSDHPVRYVINTHYHLDHVGGNENIGKTGAVIVAHDNVRERMTTNQFSEFFERETPAYPPAAWPVITFNDSMRFHLNGDVMRIMHIPNAHTDGDAIVYFEKANVLHMGDAFFGDYYPYIDFEAGGTINGYIDGLSRALELGDHETKIIPGHGSLSDNSGMATYRDILIVARDRVATLKAHGKSLAEVKAAGLTEEWDEAMGQWFITPEQFVHFIYVTLP